MSLELLVHQFGRIETLIGATEALIQAENHASLATIVPMIVGECKGFKDNLVEALKVDDIANKLIDTTIETLKAEIKDRDEATIKMKVRLGNLEEQIDALNCKAPEEQLPETRIPIV